MANQFSIDRLSKDSMYSICRSGDSHLISERSYWIVAVQ